MREEMEDPIQDQPKWWRSRQEMIEGKWKEKLEENSRGEVGTINNRNQIQDQPKWPRAGKDFRIMEIKGEIQSRTNLNGGELERIKSRNGKEFEVSVKKDNLKINQPSAKKKNHSVLTSLHFHFCQMVCLGAVSSSCDASWMTAAETLVRQLSVPHG